MPDDNAPDTSELVEDPTWTAAEFAAKRWLAPYASAISEEDYERILALETKAQEKRLHGEGQEDADEAFDLHNRAHQELERARVRRTDDGVTSSDA